MFGYHKVTAVTPDFPSAACMRASGTLEIAASDILAPSTVNVVCFDHKHHMSNPNYLRTMFFSAN